MLLVEIILAIGILILDLKFRSRLVIGLNCLFLIFLCLDSGAMDWFLVFDHWFDYLRLILLPVFPLFSGYSWLGILVLTGCYLLVCLGLMILLLNDEEDDEDDGSNDIRSDPPGSPDWDSFEEKFREFADLSSKSANLQSPFQLF